MKNIIFLFSLILIGFSILLRWLIGGWVFFLNVPFVIGVLLFLLSLFLNRKRLVQWFIFKKESRVPLGPSLIFTIFICVGIPFGFYLYKGNHQISAKVKHSEKNSQIQKNLKSIYFVKGHGERDLRDSSSVGLSQLLRVLKSDNYEILEIFLDNIPAIPDEAHLLVFAGLRKPFEKKEIQLLNEYLFNGGKIFMSFDPEFLKAPIDLSFWGIYLSDQYLEDSHSNYGEDFYESSIVKDPQFLQLFKPGLKPLVFAKAGSLQVVQNQLKNMEPSLLDQTQKKLLALKMRVKPFENSFHIVKKPNMFFVSDTEFMNNTYLNVKYNRDWLRYVIHDLVYDGKNFELLLKKSNDRLHLSANDRVTFLLLLILAPFLILLLGLLFWIRKLKRSSMVFDFKGN